MKNSKIILIIIFGLILLVVIVTPALASNNVTKDTSNNISNSATMLEGFPVLNIAIKLIENTVNTKNETNPVVKTSTNNSIDQNTVNTKFSEIRNIPYNEKTMNCKNKSELFASYLKQMGGNNIRIVVIEHDSGQYSHEFVEWNGNYYDACNTQELSYQVTEEKYMAKIQSLGFTGIKIVSPY
jgi:hypothetical protein